ncbi:MAG: MinD/ParA family protein [bacterium]
MRMIDQADDLRKLMPIDVPLTDETPSELTAIQRARVFSITSGKGGVGKTNIAVNLAYALKQFGKRVLIIDADLGLANVNILLGTASAWTLQHVVRQEKSIDEVVLTSPDGLQILPASSGVEEMTHLTVTQKLYLKSQFDLLDQQFDFILIDTAAGISSNVMSFNQMAQEVIVILSPDPTSLADAYAIIKVLATKYGVTEFHVLVNQTHNASHGKSLFQKLEKICQRFLKIPVRHLGTLSTDLNLIQASRNQQIVLKHYPKAKISQEIQKVAESIGGIPYDPWSNKSINFLLNNVLNLGQE